MYHRVSHAVPAFSNDGGNAFLSLQRCQGKYDMWMISNYAFTN